MRYVYYAITNFFFLVRHLFAKTDRIIRWFYSKILMLSVSASRMIIAKYAKYYSHVAFMILFKQDIIAWKPDVVHAHDGLALECGAVTAKAAGAEFIYDSHELETHRNPPITRFKRWQVKKLESRYLKKASAVFTVGHRIADHLTNSYGIKRPIVVYNAPQKNPTSLPAKWQQTHRTDVRSEAGIANNEMLLVYTGNLTINRGLEETVEGLAEFEKLRLDYPGLPGVHFSMVGEARGNTQKIVSEIAEKHHIRHLIHFHPAVSPTAVVSFIATADIAVIPIIPITLSYQYAMPNKLFEAMMAGLPILGARLDEMSEFISKHGLGLCYDPGSVTGFATTLIKISSDINCYKRSVSRHSSLVNIFSWEAQEEKIIAIYNAIDDKIRSNGSKKP